MKSYTTKNRLAQGGRWRADGAHAGGEPPVPPVRVLLSQGSGQLSAQSLLSFSAEITLGGEPLTEAELRRLMKSEGSLVQVRGQWVQADAERIATLLSSWKEARALEQSGGVSFVQGLRMLAGVGADGKSLAAGDVEYAASESLQAALGRLTAGAAEPLRLPKPLQMLTLLTLWKNAGALGAEHGMPPALLVLPATLLGNWQAEARRFTPGLKVGVLHPSAWAEDERRLVESDLAAFLKPYDVVLTTYGMAARMPRLQECEFAAVVADEAQAIKAAKKARRGK